MIEIDHETGAASIDRDTYNRLTQGTPFQRSLNLVAMMDEILHEMDTEFDKAAGLNRKQRRAQKRQRRKARAEVLRKEPTPMADFDPTAIDAYYN